MERIHHNQVEVEISLGNGITIEDINNGVFVWDEITPLDWRVSNYNWDVEITFANGNISTYAEGVLPIVQDTTY